MEIKGLKFFKTVKSSQILIGALVIGIMLLVIPWGNGSKEPEQEAVTQPVPSFDLQAEEKRLEEALAKIEGAGKVTVVLTLDTSSERRLAEDKENSKDTAADGSIRIRDSTQTVTLSNEAVTLIYVYPKYRGALVVCTGAGSALRLEITKAVAALTGLSTDKITVIKGTT
jgi:stage III sporulation protein AG